MAITFPSVTSMDINENRGGIVLVAFRMLREGRKNDLNANVPFLQRTWLFRETFPGWFNGRS